MQTDQPVIVRRTDYAPPAYRVEEVVLRFELEPTATIVTSDLSLRRSPGTVGPLVLDGEAIRLVDLFVDGRRLAPDEYRLETDRLLIDGLPDAVALRVVSETSPATNTALSGLYLSSGGFFTQCEAEGFRRITWFPDRPDVMAHFTVTLCAPRASCPVLLSNGNLIAEGDCGAERPGWHWATWRDPFPKPSYLFALVAARLVVRERRVKTRSGRDALLQIWVEPGNEDKTAFALDSLEHAMRWDEQRFGLELDLDRFMVVAVADFNMGAMENKGLNIFNTRYVFANPEIATDADFANVESVVGHEYFHNWTGNRVTCRDWFQLTLKEGLTVFRDQEFSADRLAASAGRAAGARSARAVKRIEDVRVLRVAQFAEDAGPMAHPIRPDTYQEINNFYTVTVYEKGAEVVRMLQTLLSRDGFRRGLDDYIARFDGQAVTCDDFLAAFAESSGRDLSQFGAWYARAGTPLVTATTEHDVVNGDFTLRLHQSVRVGCAVHHAEPMMIPFAFGLVGPDGADLPLRTPLGQPYPPAGADFGEASTILELRAEAETFRFRGIPAGAVPSLLRGFSAPVIVDYAYDDEQLAFLATHDSDPFNRWEAAQRLALATIVQVIGGAEAARRALALVEVYAGVVGDPALDPAFSELMLALPSEAFVVEQLPVVDPVALRRGRNAVRDEIARALAERWQSTVRELAPREAYAPTPAQAGRRGLRNVCLGYWVASGATTATEHAVAQFRGADNMTDRAGALAALCLADAGTRDAMLDEFASRHAQEPLAMDKWFTMQATMQRRPDEPPVLARVTKLLDHPAFSRKNPNKVRALVGAFCSGNLAEFHAADGSGYAFWASEVLAIDAINPQVAARIARALDRWRKFDDPRRRMMRSVLEEVARAPRLSNDVAEIVGKALAEPDQPDGAYPRS